MYVPSTLLKQVPKVGMHYVLFVSVMYRVMGPGGLAATLQGAAAASPPLVLVSWLCLARIS
jgi:hypothetical protein